MVGKGSRDRLLKQHSKVCLQLRVFDYGVSNGVTVILSCDQK